MERNRRGFKPALGKKVIFDCLQAGVALIASPVARSSQGGVDGAKREEGRGFPDFLDEGDGLGRLVIEQ